MKKIIILLLGTLLFSKTCECIFRIKKSKPFYPHIFYTEKFNCKNQNEGYKYQKKLGCRKRIIWKNKIRYEILICPSWVNLVKN